MKKIFSIFWVVVFMFCAQNVLAFNPNQQIYLNQSYDLYSRASIDVAQIKATNVAIFYADKYWWDNLSLADQNILQNKIYLMSTELEYKIKPTLNNLYGKEPDPIVGNDKRVNIVFTPMTANIQGYIKTSDFVPKNVSAISNEGNVIYLNATKIKSLSDNLIYSFLAHEFTHIITYNQKYIISGAHDDVWLEELRAEYTPTLLGYNTNWDTSYLKLRVLDFVQNNIISLSDWDSLDSHYAFVNLFAQYLTEQYGRDIIINSFHSSKTGIDSINEFLVKNGKSETFDQIFQNWLIANFLNDCSVSTKYCYKDVNLKNIYILPSSFYLPMSSNSALAISDTLIPYMAKYQKISGGAGNLSLNFENPPDNLIKKIPYIIIDKNNSKQLSFFDFQKSNSQTIVVPNFNKEVIGLVIIPQLVRQDKNYSTRSVFKWQAETSSIDIGNSQNVSSTNSSAQTSSDTKPNTNNIQNIDVSLITRLDNQAKIIELQNKLIILMQQLIALLLAR